MFFNRFDILEAYHLYGMMHNAGFTSEPYKVLCRLHKLHFNPRPSLRSSSNLSANGREIYRKLVSGVMPSFRNVTPQRKVSSKRTR